MEDRAVFPIHVKGHTYANGGVHNRIGIASGSFNDSKVNQWQAKQEEGKMHPHYLQLQNLVSVRRGGI